MDCLVDGKKLTPYRLTTVGQEIYELRNKYLTNSLILKVLKSGGEVTTAQITAVIPEFSLGSLATCKDESSLIHKALTKSKSSEAASDEVHHLETSNSFNSTIVWATKMLTDQPRNASEVIFENFSKCCTGKLKGPPVAFQWAKYEYLRRCHLALELILLAVAEGLDHLGETTIAQIVSYWIEEFKTDTELDNIWPCAKKVRYGSASEAIESIECPAFFDGPIAVNKLQGISASKRPYAAIALLVATLNRTQALRKSRDI